MSDLTEPQLAAPGAGLPAPELFVARKLFALKCKLGSRESFLEEFRGERAKIGACVESCPVERRGERVLVPRLRGLEDSSRHGSVWMVLDHLRIVNAGILGILTELSDGRIPDGELGTADVKADPAVGAAVELDYAQGCDAFLAWVEAAGELRSELRYPHPWFGPLDANKWLGLASMHMGIHRAQIAAIIRGLNL